MLPLPLGSDIILDIADTEPLLFLPTIDTIPLVLLLDGANEAPPSPSTSKTYAGTATLIPTLLFAFTLKISSPAALSTLSA